jgi:branched-chain amino acid transport system permease protein
MRESNAANAASKWSKPPRRSLPTFLLSPAAALVLVALGALTPKFTADPFLLSFVPTIIVTLLAALHVWLLFRVNLLSFGSPPFMAIGGYALALTATHLTSNAVVLLVTCFLVPALFALPLGLILLRLRGTYFSLVTFVLAQVVVLVIVIAEGPLGGNSGISGIPPASFGSLTFGAGGDLVRFSVMVAFVGVAIASGVSVVWRRHFAAIAENEALAASLGLRPWVYKTLAFVTAAGVAGLAGLVLTNQLGNAHPDSFQPFSAVNHVAAAVIGGPSMLGPLVGAFILAWLVHLFASQAQYSQLLLGFALIVVTLFAKNGITGLFHTAGCWLIKAFKRTRDTRSPGQASVQDPMCDTPAIASSGSLMSKCTRWDDETAEVVLQADGLAKRFGGVAAVDGLSFTLRKGEILGVIGPNGAGKTTIINLVSGAMAPTSGTVALRGKAVTGYAPHRMSRQGIARSYQQTSVFSGATVRENLARAKAFSRRWIGDDALGELLAVTGLMLRLDDRAGDLPYGLQKLLGLVLPLATEPDVILLDEPAAGLEISERRRIDQLVEWAVERGSSVLLVEHDMDLVRRICPRILVMDVGRPLAEGAPEQVLANQAVITAYLGVADDEDEDTDVVAASDQAEVPRG